MSNRAVLQQAIQVMLDIQLALTGFMCPFLNAGPWLRVQYVADTASLLVL